jgi:hypothetical protein
VGLEAGTRDAWLHADDPTLLQVSAAAASENGGEVGENAAEAQAWIDKWSSKNANQPDLECTGEYVNPRWESVEQVLSYSHKVGVRAPLTSERVNYKRVRRATDSGAGAMPINPTPGAGGGAVVRRRLHSAAGVRLLQHRLPQRSRRHVHDHR